MPKEDWEKLIADVETIRKAIIGDDMGNLGLLKRMNIVEDKLSGLLTKALIASAFMSGALWAAKWFISKEL